MNLQVTNLFKSFYRSPVIKSFSLSVNSGERIGISGPNGSGKTTLLKMLSGIMAIDSGDIQVGNHFIDPEFTLPRKSIHYLGHSAGAYPGLTGEENLIFISGLYGMDALGVTECLEKVGLDSAKEKQIKYYSQGMLQRLKLAITILLDSDILLLDEPLSGLDSNGIQLFQQLLDEWQENKKTMLIVSHDHNWLSSITDRIIYLN